MGYPAAAHLTRENAPRTRIQRLRMAIAGLRPAPYRLGMDGQILTLIAIACVLVGAALRGVGLDAVALLALAILVIGARFVPDFDFTAREAVQGFGTTTLLIVAGMFVLADALQRTGAADWIGALVERSAKRGPRFTLLLLLPLVMGLSAVMNNTGVVVLLLPILVSAGQKAGVSPSRLLLPLSYASIVGGTLTLVGTSTTLLVAGLVIQAGHVPLGFLDILPMGLVFCFVGLVYMVVFGPRLLPDRVGLLTAMTPETTRQYVTEVLVTPSSRLVGRRLNEFPALLEQVRFLQLVRGEESHWPPFVDQVLQANDLLVVKGAPERIVKLLAQPGLDGPPDPDSGGRITGIDLALAEVMIPPRSRLDHLTVVEARMRKRFGVVVLAVMRHGGHIRDQLGALRLREGDVLLVQGSPEDLARLGAFERDLMRLGGSLPDHPRRRKAPVAVLITTLALAAGAFGLAPLSMSILVGCIAVVVLGCLTSSQAYGAIDLRILVVLGAMFGVGLAAERSGLAQDIANALLEVAGPLGPRAVLICVVIVTSLLTEVVSNAGTAAVMTPIALKAAEVGQWSDRPFIFAVALAASSSFLTPVGYQTNLLVYGPGGYRISDYLRFGLPLQVTLWFVCAALLPVFYPL